MLDLTPSRAAAKLSRYLDEAAALVPQVRKLLLSRTATPAERIDAVEQFLAG